MPSSTHATSGSSLWRFQNHLGTGVRGEKTAFFLLGQSARILQVGKWIPATYRFFPKIKGASDFIKRFRALDGLRPFPKEPKFTLLSWAITTRLFPLSLLKRDLRALVSCKLMCSFDLKDTESTCAKGKDSDNERPANENLPFGVFGPLGVLQKLPYTLWGPTNFHPISFPKLGNNLTEMAGVSSCLSGGLTFQLHMFSRMIAPKTQLSKRGKIGNHSGSFPKVLAIRHQSNKISKNTIKQRQQQLPTLQSPHESISRLFSSHKTPN